MGFQPKRRLGILLMAVCLVFIIATACTLFLRTDEGNHSEAPPDEGGHSWTVENEGSEGSSWEPEAIWSSAYPDGFEQGGSGLDVPHSGSR